MRFLLATVFLTISCSIAFAGAHGEHGGGWHHGDGGGAWHHDGHGDGRHGGGGRWWHGRWFPWGGSCWQWHSLPGGWVWTCH